MFKLTISLTATYISGFELELTIVKSFVTNIRNGFQAHHYATSWNRPSWILAGVAASGKGHAWVHRRFGWGIRAAPPLPSSFLPSLPTQNRPARNRGPFLLGLSAARIRPCCLLELSHARPRTEREDMRPCSAHFPLYNFVTTVRKWH